MARGQLSLTHSTKVKTDMPEKMKKKQLSLWSQSCSGKIKELWRKGYVEKISLEPGVEEREK